MQEATLAPRSRRQKLAVAAGLLAGWLIIAGLSFAAWNTTASSTLTVTTTSPAGGTLAFAAGESITFNDDAQSDQFQVTVTLPDTPSTAEYTYAVTQATSSLASGGCPAGAVTVAAGQGVPSAGGPFAYDGVPSNTGQLITASMGPGAPSACSNSTIQLPVTLTLMEAAP